MDSGWSRISIFFFFIVALIGTSLRAVSFLDLPFKFSNLVHAHSHVAFQGWIYTILFLLMTHLFLDKKQVRKRKYVLQFKITMGVLFGILISFSLQGYGLYSILFSTLFQLLNYWFIYSFLKDTRDNTGSAPRISIRFVRTGLWFGILSTLAPWGIGIVSAKGLAGTDIYRSFIYFFLHFQYNGWFLFVTIGLLFKVLENKNVYYKPSYALWFYRLFSFAVIPAYTLSLLGMNIKKYIIIPAFFSAGIQAVGLVFLLLLIRSFKGLRLEKTRTLIDTFSFLSVIAFFLKVILQLVSVFPYFREIAFFNKRIILAYLHLSFIGVLSFTIFALLMQIKWLNNNSNTVIAGFLLIVGFVITEIVLVWNDFWFIDVHWVMLLGSLMMTIGILLLMLAVQKNKMQTNNE